jgi:hypothetical protein
VGVYLRERRLPLALTVSNRPRMHLKTLPLALIVYFSAAQLPNFTHGGGACVEDWDCALSGMCVSSACVCDIWATGPQCTYLNLQPADSLTSQGLQAPSYYSWGGHTLKDDADNYHLFASFMCDHASLGSWTSKSSVAHAVSPSPIGPFTFPEGLDEQLVVPPWSHGAYITRDPPTGEYLLWHLGNGAIDPKTWAPCFNSSQAVGGGAPPPDAPYAPLHAPPGQRQAFVQTAPSLNVCFDANRKPRPEKTKPYPKPYTP